MDLILTSDWAIELASDAVVAQFAAAELQQLLQQIGAPQLRIVDKASGPRIQLAHGDLADAAGDAFRRMRDAQGLRLHGEGPRGLLYAVYDLLEVLGCSWFGPGNSAGYLPRYQSVRLPSAVATERPSLAGRCLIIGQDLFLSEAEGWIVWAARNRLNQIFIHTISQPLALGACKLRSWHQRRKQILPLLRERGMTLELGGHHLRDLIPRRLFRQKPELFRHNGRQRTPDSNFCPTHPYTQKLLRANAAVFFRLHPEAQIYHLWPDDLIGGGWCSCPNCAGFTPAEQALLATNMLAEALAEHRPDAQVSYLSYHDTEAAPTRVTPHPQVTLLFAPRPRSYAVGIGEAGNLLNQKYADYLASNMERFSQNPPRTAVFEYYLDGILFKGGLPPLPSVIAEDLRYYQASGVHTVQALMTGDRPWQSAPINAYLFARLAWNTAADPQELLARYAALRAPRSPDAFLQAYSALEEAWRGALDRVPAEAALRVEQPLLRDPVSAPPADVLDYMAAPRPFSEQRLEQLRRAEEALRRGQLAWAQVLSQATESQPALSAERSEWAISATLIHFMSLRQQLYVLAARKADQATLRRSLAAAQQALDTYIAQGAVTLPPKARPGYTLVRNLLQLQLDYIFDQHLATPLQRLSLRSRRAYQLGQIYLRLQL